MVNSFETVGSSLVEDKNFMEFTFTQSQLTVEASTVSKKCVFFRIVYLVMAKATKYL